MTTWAEIIEIKLNRIKEKDNLIKAKEDKKKSTKFFIRNFIYLVIFGLIIYFAFNSGKKDDVQFKIGQEINYKNGFGELKLYQLGQRKLSKTEQSNNGFKFDTKQNLINTNSVSEKFFVKNETNLIGTIIDSLMIEDKKWLKIQLNPKLFNLPINFDPDSEKFNIKLQVFKEKNELSSLSKDFYVNLDEIKDLIRSNE